jgi:hypothetical protein
MCGHIQATLRHIRGPGDPELYQNPQINKDNIHSNTKADGTMQTPYEVAMRNGKFSDGSKWRTLRVPPPHCKPNHKSHIAALIWKRDWATCPGNAGVQHRHQHHLLYQEKPGTTEQSKDVTYGLITYLIRPDKIEESNKTMLVVGGNRVHYPGNAGTPTADLLTVKLLINSTISTPNAKYTTMDIKNFYLNTPMAQYKYMRLQIANMPDDVIKHYHLTDLATLDGYVYCKIQKGMYSLPQAGIIAQQLREK